MKVGRAAAAVEDGVSHAIRQTPKGYGAANGVIRQFVQEHLPRLRGL